VEPINSTLGQNFFYLTQEDCRETEAQFDFLDFVTLSPREMQKHEDLQQSVPIHCGESPSEKTPLEEYLLRIDELVEKERDNNQGWLPNNLTSERIAQKLIEESRQGKWKPQFNQDEEATGPRVVAAGIDSLYLSAEFPILEDVTARLSALKLRSEERDTFVVCQGHRFQVLPYGGKPFWRYILKGQTMTVKLRHKPSAGQPTAMFEIRSTWLWRDGPFNVIKSVERLVSSWSGGHAARLKVSRLDVAADFTNWQLEASTLLDGRWVTRSRRRTLYFAGDKRQDGESALHYHGKHFTGMAFGKGDISARIYRKDIEIKKSGKTWMESVWKSSGYSDGEPVWRVEFQLRGDGLKNWLVEGSGERRAGSGFITVFKSLDSVWSYLTGRDSELTHRGGRAWLSLRDKTNGKNQSQWPISREWLAVASVRWPGRGFEATRLPTRRSRRVPEWVERARCEAQKAARQIQRRSEGYTEELESAADAFALDAMGIRKHSERIDPLQVASILVRAEEVMCMAGFPSSQLSDGYILNAFKAANGAYLTEAEQRAARLGPQAAGTAIAMAAALDGAGAAEDPPDEETAVRRVVATIREALRADGNVKEKMVSAKNKQVYNAAYDRKILELTE
jgi:hypothetical protein